MAEIQLKNLTKRWGSFVGVDNFNLTIANEEFLVLLGPSGCGKTTTMRMIAGLEEVTEGEIIIDGKVVNGLEPKDRDVAMVFQSYALYPNMNVYENIRFPLKVRKVDKELHDERVMRAVAMVELEDFLHRKPSELSGGQRQRVALARAIVREPTVFLMDEPLSNLDAKLRVSTRAQIKNLQHELRVTTIYVTHDQEEALAISDKVIVMNNAIIAQEGRPEDLYNNPKTTFVANFIGDANIVKARIETRNENNYDINFGGIQMKISSNIDLKDSVSIALRPETIEIIKEKTNNCMAAKIINASYVGSCYQYVVSSSVGELFIVSNEINNHFKLNEEVFITFDESGITILED